MKNILVVTAVTVEQEAVLKGLNQQQGFEVITAGVGPVAAATGAATALAKGSYDLVLSMGIAGGFAERAPLGSVVLANQIVAADLGVLIQDSFQSIEELGFGTSRIEPALELVARLKDSLDKTGQKTCVGPILTLSTVTGTAEAALELLKRVPQAAAEAMEGFGVAYAAHAQQIPVLEIRTISNLVGPRDRASWKIKEALEKLTEVAAQLPEVCR